MADYLEIKNKIISKIEKIKQVKLVYSYEKQDLGGYPAVVILGFNVNDIIEDTITNLREYIFKVRVFQEIKGVKPSKAEEIIDNLIDILMDTFATDFTLGGTCEGCWVSAGLGWIDRETEMRVYDLEVTAKKLVSALPIEEES